MQPLIRILPPQDGVVAQEVIDVDAEAHFARLNIVPSAWNQPTVTHEPEAQEEPQESMAMCACCKTLWSYPTEFRLHMDRQKKL